MDFTPTTLHQIALARGRLELVEWRFPDMIDFWRTETDLMLEMSLPPHSADASAEFPDIAPGQHCFMGTLFVRYPDVALHGRGEGGHIRVMRAVFAPAVADSILGRDSLPPLRFLQSLLDIRNDSLRALMRLACRELTNEVDQSADALDALFSLLVVEMRRLFERQPHGHASGRLAAWQYRRIRERVAEGGEPPSAADLAALCGVSPRHLHRQFQALTGSTIAKYVENSRIERAKDMLVNTDLPVKNIAFSCGFPHPNSFARVFRRVTGLPPHIFRQRATQGDQK